jgi:hypothetical protein
MAAQRRVRGHLLPPPRPTRWALIYVLLYLGLPIVGLLALLDLVLYLVLTVLLGRCYGLHCLWS